MCVLSTQGIMMALVGPLSHMLSEICVATASECDRGKELL